MLLQPPTGTRMRDIEYGQDIASLRVIQIVIDKSRDVQACYGTLSACGRQCKITILCRGIQEGVTGKIEQHKVIVLSAYQEEFTQLALQLIASCCLARQIDHVLR